jgi:hypothetical protein
LSQIRDLETRVEILSGGTDQAVNDLKNMLKGMKTALWTNRDSSPPDLMEENQTLRTLLRSLGAFIGEGAGGLLPKLGWDMADFNNFINRSETDTAWQGYQRRKKGSEAAMPQGQKRSADEDSSNARKKTRANEHDVDAGQNGYPVLVNMNPPMPSNNMYARDGNNAMFSDLMRGSNGSPMFSNPTASANASPTFASGSQSNYQNSYISGVNMGVDPSLPPLSFSPASNVPSATMQQQQQQQQTNQMSTPDQAEEDDDPNKSEAYKLIQ